MSSKAHGKLFNDLLPSFYDIPVWYLFKEETTETICALRDFTGDIAKALDNHENDIKELKLDVKAAQYSECYLTYAYDENNTYNKVLKKDDQWNKFNTKVETLVGDIGNKFLQQGFRQGYWASLSQDLD